VTLSAKSARESDGYAGITWAQRSQLQGLRAVLDPGDAGGKKNAYIDAVHASTIETLLKRAAPFDRALDFGCGIGRFVPLLAAYARQVDGVDRTPEMLEIARASGRIPKNRAHLWRDGRLPFDDATFDVILCVYVLSCIPDTNAHAALQELRRVAKPDCRFILLEQIAPARGLNRDHYRASLGDAGFRLCSERPVRAGSSVFSSLAVRSWFPPALAPAAAALERRLAPLRHYRPYQYYDSAMLATPRP
jgi:SAM-dependent methyltransferase